MRQFALAGLVLALAVPAAAQTVRIDTGVLKGASAEGVASFKNIPYAAPPIGPLRWRPPQPAPAWRGERDARAYGPLCLQAPSKDNGVGPPPASEDCLSLNVFSADLAGHAPVMVWIHGGGFVNGSGTAALYDGAALARQGVVVVTINYRLGRFGFFAHPSLTREGGLVGDYALMDMVAALEWVKRDIAAFGGDPAKVTIFGESAGGVAVNQLMLMPQARGLFTAAISESGLGRDPTSTLAEAETRGAAFGAELGVRGDRPDAAAALRALPAETILAAGDRAVTGGDLPIADGVMITGDPVSGFRAGREARVPFIVGTNALELPPAWGGYKKGLGGLGPADEAALVQAYGARDVFETRIRSDLTFGEPGRTLARLHAAHGAPTWLYRFSILSDQAPKTLTATPHAQERQYVFQTLNASPWPTGARDAALARQVSAYWTDFAKTGSPNSEGRPVWPAYGPSDQLLNFTNSGPVAQTTPDAVVLDLIGRRRDAQPAGQ